MNMRGLWIRITTTRYARALETELVRLRVDNERLRAENRALLNSILGIAGVPPLPASVEDLAAVENQARHFPDASVGARSRDFIRDAKTAHAVPAVAQTRSWHAAATRSPAGGSASAPHVAVPMRKRSWQQINRMLEFESARKDKPAADALANGRV
jgi:hypothetical protein